MIDLKPDKKSDEAGGQCSFQRRKLGMSLLGLAHSADIGSTDVVPFGSDMVKVC